MNIIVIAEHFKNSIEDITFEMLGKGKELAGATGGQLIAVLLGNDAKALADNLRAAARIVYCDSPHFAEFNPEAYGKALAAIVPGLSPGMILVANTSAGMDLAAGLSVDLGIPLVAYANAITAGSATSQLYGGKVNVESALAAGPVIIAVLPGSFAADAGKGGGAPAVEAVAAPDFSSLKTRFNKRMEPESGDVDITQQDVLVSVGRGIQNEENLAIVQALADKLGGALASSRPIVDNKWLPKTRQVGKSGLKVKPKVYLAVGISGAPEHWEGMKDAECIIAINVDPKAPIFGFAHYGTTADLFDVVPAITAAI
ncbi:MAG: electron transfer flavoprotein subunit alpha/FixB family protein [Saprospirales bacterium]|jgi:electron transfer flavoprotein alpha subunit|nr:electron transfer flavoprotein subunit alpha/FixB family protein [Saprospirales bacterium]MBK8920936.1 electron transfer flavoprotein subunit alpha/FixB family protein [Saprospirales bacterium]